MKQHIEKVLCNSVALPSSLLSAPSSFPQSCAGCRSQALLGICVSQPAGELLGELTAASVASGRLEQKVPQQSGCIRLEDSDWDAQWVLFGVLDCIGRAGLPGKHRVNCCPEYTVPVISGTETSISADHLLKPGIIHCLTVPRRIIKGCVGPDACGKITSKG